MPPAETTGTLRIRRSGFELIADPLLNKGMAFTDPERDAFSLHGLLPPHVATLDDQVARRLEAFGRIDDDLARYSFLRDLQDTNETLFYALLTRNLPELLPVVYTPTVGLGCQRFSHVYRKPRGLFLGPPHADRLDEILAHPRFDDVAVIVVSDGERILGLGDQGAGGMGIPIGKLSLYTGCGGIHPGRTLPILLDTGTDNAELRDDPLYIGWRHARVRGAEYDAFVEAFVGAVARRFPHVLLQWEDFAGANAARLLAAYRDRLCTFNDDIQGTAAVVAGTLLAAVAAAGGRLADQRVVLLGAGSAGIGICRLLMQGMVEEGLDEDEARGRFVLVDRDGLVVSDAPELTEGQRFFACAPDTLPPDRRRDLAAVVDATRPTVLLGVTGQPGLFTEDAVRTMARHAERPLIFPLSNPTSRSEAAPSDIMAWTEGRAIIGTGSPFPPVEVGGRRVRIDQVNNSYIFPGVGLGVIAAQARRVTDAMFLAAARALAELSPSRADKDATLLPPVSDLRAVSRHVAIRVVEQARREGFAAAEDADAGALVDACVWTPVYRPYARADDD